MTPDREIAGYAIAAGWAGDDAVTATAIALAESGGDETAHRNNPFEKVDAYGLWQINMFGDLGRQRRKDFGDLLGSDSVVSNPLPYYQLLRASTNAQAAYKVFQSGGGFKQWSTWTSGKYRDFMGRAKTAVENSAKIHLPQPGDVATHNVLSDIFDPMIAIANAIRNIAISVVKAGAWMANPHNWVRAALVGLGGSLVIGALVIVAKPALQPAVNMAEKVVSK